MTIQSPSQSAVGTVGFIAGGRTLLPAVRATVPRRSAHYRRDRYVGTWAGRTHGPFQPELNGHCVEHGVDSRRPRRSRPYWTCTRVG